MNLKRNLNQWQKTYEKLLAKNPKNQKLSLEKVM
jgi:hypothetical protein